MSNRDILKKLDDMIYQLSEMAGTHHWEIRLRSDVARELFGDPIPDEYKGYPIKVDNDGLMEVETDEGMKSDIWVLQRK